ncbi:MAG: hypothetical protein JNN00_15675 [Chitinophagaceae bacterium]|nr:hypothetical protein [Chitinophagaceae bacterium]
MPKSKYGRSRGFRLSDWFSLPHLPVTIHNYNGRPHNDEHSGGLKAIFFYRSLRHCYPYIKQRNTTSASFSPVHDKSRNICYGA